MDMQMWGPALDAELAYRRESVEAGVRRGRASSTDRTPGRATDDVGRTRQSRGRRRRWWLVGSGAWHAAR